MTRAMIAVAVMLSALSARAQTAQDVRGATELVALDNEPPAKLIVDPPIPEQLALGHVFIQYRTEHLRILPVYNATAVGVSPRIGHLHVFVDGETWHFVVSSDATLILVGLSPGPHSVVLELADPAHKPITRQTVRFVVPATRAP